MRYLGAWLWVVVASIAVLPAAFGQEGPAGVLQTFPEGKVDWGSARVFVPGEGKPKPDAGGLQRRLTARNAARESALAGLEKILTAIAPEGTSASKGADRQERLKSIFQSSPVLTNDDPESQALGYADLGWNAAEDRYRVAVAVPLFGPRGVAAALSTRPLPPASAKPEPEESADRGAAQGAATGLIVDCGKASAKPSLAPTLVDQGTKKPLYGPASVDAEAAIRLGLARYHYSVEDARGVAERVGASPLVVRGSIAPDGSVQLAAEDAKRVRDADQASGFLNRCAVIIVIGR